MLARIWNYVSNNPLVAGLLVLLVGSGSAWAWVAPARVWLSADARVVRGALVVLVLLLLIAVTVILRLTTALRRERHRMQPAAPPGFEPYRFERPMQAPPQPASLTTSAAALPLTKLVPMPTQELPTAVQLAPETFKLTPSRCRALIVLLHRVDQRTNLHELRELVVTDGHHEEQYPTSKAQVLQDMEDAERAGIVSIERIDKLTQLFSLTPDGRRWSLGKERSLQTQALKGMYEKRP